MEKELEALKKFMAELACYASLSATARYVGCTVGTVSNWRAGKCMPRPYHGEKLALMYHQLKKQFRGVKK